MKQLNILDEKQVVCSGFVTYTQEVIELAKAGYTLDVRSVRCPQFMLGLFTCNMLLLDDTVDTVAEIATNVADVATEAKPRRTYAKSEKAKAALRSKVPADALQTITK